MSWLQDILGHTNTNPVHKAAAEALLNVIASLETVSSKEHNITLHPDGFHAKFASVETGKAFVQALSACGVICKRTSVLKPYDSPILSDDCDFGEGDSTIKIPFEINFGAAKITRLINQHLAGWGKSTGFHINGDKAWLNSVEPEGLRGKVFIISIAESLHDPRSFRIELEKRVKIEGASRNNIHDYVSSETATLIYSDGVWEASDNLADLTRPITGLWSDFVAGIEEGLAGCAKENGSDEYVIGASYGEEIASRQTARSQRSQQSSADRPR